MRFRHALAGGIVTAVAVLALNGGAAQAASHHWSLVNSPDSSFQENVLNGVSCVGSSFCMAAGSYYTGTQTQTLIEGWNGSTWSLISSPNSSNTQSNSLAGVSCASKSFCMAVGSYFNGSNVQTLVEEWTGTSWGLVNSPNSSNTQSNNLNAVSCASKSFCMAVGSYFNGSVQQTLVEEWTGTSWGLVNSPDTSSTQDNSLNGVSCVSMSFCMAAGDYSNATSNQTLIERWNGSTWSLVSSPDTSNTTNNILNAVSCVSTSFCMAAGIYENGIGQTLLETWTGSSWALVSSPNTSNTQNNVLNGVSCISMSFCMAAGWYGTEITASQTLTEKWNGSSWSLVSSANANSLNNLLNAVSCVSKVTSCMAAGDYFNGSHDQTLIERW